MADRLYGRGYVRGISVHEQKVDSMRYILMKIENGNENMIAYGTSLEGMRSIVRNSPQMFKDGYVIYETRVVEYA